MPLPDPPTPSLCFLSLEIQTLASPRDGTLSYSSSRRLTQRNGSHKFLLPPHYPPVTQVRRGDKAFFTTAQYANAACAVPPSSSFSSHRRHPHPHIFLRFLLLLLLMLLLLFRVSSTFARRSPYFRYVVFMVVVCTVARNNGKNLMFSRKYGEVVKRGARSREEG
jgi:hypothetical protein